MSEWISVKDKLPPKYGYYLTYNENHYAKCDGAKYEVLRWRYDKKEWYPEREVTHWIKIPEKPKYSILNTCTLPCII